MACWKIDDFPIETSIYRGFTIEMDDFPIEIFIPRDFPASHEDQRVCGDIMGMMETYGDFKVKHRGVWKFMDWSGSINQWGCVRESKRIMKHQPKVRMWDTQQKTLWDKYHS